MHARYYDGAVGKFLSVDPGRSWDAKQPQSWNRYAYANNNPMKCIDPNGEAAASFTGFILHNSDSATRKLGEALDKSGDVGRSRVFDSENYHDAAEFLIREYARNPALQVLLVRTLKRNRQRRGRTLRARNLTSCPRMTRTKQPQSGTVFPTIRFS
jgi:uncharacterized protein RhaS with RHS repeats